MRAIFQTVLAFWCLLILSAGANGVFAQQKWPQQPRVDKSENVTFSLIGTTIWANEYGSTIALTVRKSGMVSGSYINRAPNSKCRRTPYPITGWVLGEMITFAVQWNNSYENCNTVTGWAGYLVQGGSSQPKLVTQWNLVSQASTGPVLRSGQDVFKPLMTKEEKAALLQ